MLGAACRPSLLIPRTTEPGLTDDGEIFTLTRTVLRLSRCCCKSRSSVLMKSSYSSSYTVLMSTVLMSVMFVIRNVVNHVAGEVFIHSANVHCVVENQVAQC